MSEHCFIFLFYTKTVNQVVYVAYVWTLFYFLDLHKDSTSSCILFYFHMFSECRICQHCFIFLFYTKTVNQVVYVAYVWTLFYFLVLHKDSKSSYVCSICLNHCFIFLFYTKTVNQVVYVAYVWTLFYFLDLHKDSKSSCVCSICLNIVLFSCSTTLF